MPVWGIISHLILQNDGLLLEKSFSDASLELERPQYKSCPVTAFESETLLCHFCHLKNDPLKKSWTGLNLVKRLLVCSHIESEFLLKCLKNALSTLGNNTTKTFFLSYPNLGSVILTRKQKTHPPCRSSMGNKHLLFVQCEVAEKHDHIVSHFCHRHSEPKRASTVGETRENVNVSQLGTLSLKLNLKLHSKRDQFPHPPLILHEACTEQTNTFTNI